MTVDVDLENRLRRVAPVFKEGVEPSSTLHADVMTRTGSASTDRRLPLMREVALAAALLIVVGLLGFGVAKLRAMHPGPVRSTPPKGQVIPWTASPMVLPPTTAELLSPADVAAKLLSTVTSSEPLLLPQNIAADYQAEVLADSNGFAVDYISSTHHVTIALASSQSRLPTPGARGHRTARLFRGVVATYQVDDATPLAPRWLYWTEPNSNQGAPFSLIADGLTDMDFWQVANSLEPVQPPTALRPCLASDLHAVIGGGNGASGQLFNSILFSNHGATPCQLDGTPGIVLRTTSGEVIALPQTNSLMPWMTSSPPPARMTANSPDPIPRSSSPFEQAYVDFSMWDCPANPPLGTVTIVLPNNRGTISLPAADIGYSWGGECEGNRVARLQVSPFVGTGPQPTPTYLENSALLISLKAPTTVRAGTLLRYQVVLTNASGAPFRFHDCPSYTEDASRPGSKLVANYQLNCWAVGWLAPNEQVTFDMQLAVPAGNATGSGYLRWSMRSAYGGGQAQAPLTIE